MLKNTNNKIELKIENARKEFKIIKSLYNTIGKPVFCENVF